MTEPAQVWMHLAGRYAAMEAMTIARDFRELEDDDDAEAREMIVERYLEALQAFRDASVALSIHGRAESFADHREDLEDLRAMVYSNARRAGLLEEMTDVLFLFLSKTPHSLPFLFQPSGQDQGAAR